MSEKHRPIRSFVRRQGRMTPGQKAAFDKSWTQYGLNLSQGKLDFTEVFQRNADTILEIGTGMGEALLSYAHTHPQYNFIGIEVHTPGIGALLMGIEKQLLKNVRLFNEDAIDILNECIENDALTGIHLFFPDPWHKKRHQKRRIVNENFAELIRAKLKIDGYIHMATDWENYAQQMMSVFSQAPGFINVAGQRQFVPRPDSRPATRFEKRGERLGHGVWDLKFIREF